MTPTTKAGRALLDRRHRPSPTTPAGILARQADLDAILAIEREAAAETEALRAALENILDQFNRDNSTAQAAFYMADIARAALATPAPAAPAYCDACGYRVTDDPGSCLRPDNHAAPAALPDASYLFREPAPAAPAEPEG